MHVVELAPSLRPEPMMLDDVPRVALIEAQVSLSPWSQAIFRDCLQAGYQCWVYRQVNVNAYLVLSCAAREAHLLNIAVQPEWQASGLGGRILDFAIELARQEDVGRMFLEVRPSNHRAQKLYRSRGFSLLHKRKAYYGPPHQEDAMVFSLDL